MTFQQNSSSTNRGASDLVATLISRAPRLALALAASQAAWPVAKSLRNQVRERTAYTVKVESTDDVYDDLHEWVLGLLPADRQRALIAWTSRRSAEPDEWGGGKDSSVAKRVRLRYDGSREQLITVDGHRVRVVVTNANEQVNEKRWKPSEIVFTMHAADAQRALVRHIDRIAGQRTARQPRFHMLSSWGDWQRLDELAPRTLESVVLPAAQRERLVGDLRTFLDSEALYGRRNVPWHRGHLYAGPPGTGKTSVARALAHHFAMDVWYLPLGDVDKDCNLLAAISRITPRSMLLLEDVDVFSAATNRQEASNKASLSGLLNALDGLATPHGLFTVLTTNRLEAIDSAVRRPGRVDLVETFDLAGSDEVLRLAVRWFDRPMSAPLWLSQSRGVGIAPAKVVETCKRSSSPDEFWKLLRSSQFGSLT